MGYIVGVVSQKGGVGKSTLSRAIATTYAAAGWNVKVADLDINQASSFSWSKRREAREIKPAVNVGQYGSVADALRRAGDHDLMVLDGAPHATRDTVDIGKRAHMIVMPTGLALDDLEPTVVLANTLVEKHDIPLERIAIALVKTGDSLRELEEARAYLSATPYHVLASQIPEKTAFRRAQDSGQSVVECPYRGPREQADTLIQSLIDRLEAITN